MRYRPKDPPDEMVWTPWFAWHPVTCIDGTIVWLERVEARYLNCDGMGLWDYRLVESQ